MRRLPIRVGLAVLLLGGATFAGLALTGGGESDDRARPRGTAGQLIDPGTPLPKTPRRPRVILIVLDEFPPDLLLGPDGRIDAVRYPNFAALAKTGYWFPNATTVYDSTSKATPEIMDAKLPRPGTAPNFLDHPRTVYDLFGPRGYRIVSSEEATSICPPRYCAGAVPQRPQVLANLRGGRRERLRRFFGSIEPGDRPTFHIKHFLLPHGPYMFLPSGKQTRRGSEDPVPEIGSPKGFHDRFLTEHNEQRLRLQIAYVDRELGALFARMKRERTLDTSLIAITADHGLSFELGVADRRTVTESNIHEIAPVPLFIKAPGQRRGRTERSYVRTIDIVPTIADLLGFRMPYRADGRSAFSRETRRRRFVQMIERDFSGRLLVSAQSLERRRRTLVRRKLAMFGSGDWRALYSGIGPNRALLGRDVAGLRPVGRGTIGATIAQAGDMRDVRPASIILPTQVAGLIRGGRPGARRDIAVAVNGRIRAVGRTFYLQGAPRESFSVMVPESALRAGRNAVEVLEVTNRGRRLRLLGRT